MAFNRIHFYSLPRPINGCGACRFEVFGKRHFKAEKKDNPAVPRIIPNNHITLFQNGEAYFPAIEAALDRAMHEIYLESWLSCGLVRFMAGMTGYAPGKESGQI